MIAISEDRDMWREVASLGQTKLEEIESILKA